MEGVDAIPPKIIDEDDHRADVQPAAASTTEEGAAPKEKTKSKDPVVNMWVDIFTVLAKHDTEREQLDRMYGRHCLGVRVCSCLLTRDELKHENIPFDGECPGCHHPRAQHQSEHAPDTLLKNGADRKHMDETKGLTCIADRKCKCLFTRDEMRDGGISIVSDCPFCHHPLGRHQRMETPRKRAREDEEGEVDHDIDEPDKKRRRTCPRE
jgi:hypothetical protein